MSRKIENPPAVHNWARNVDPDYHKMVNLITNFLIRRPQYNFSEFQRIARDSVILGISREAARKASLSSGHTKSRPYVRAAIDPFFDYIEKHGLVGRPSYDHITEYYRFGPRTKIPCSPTAIVSGAKGYLLLLALPWKNLPFSDFHFRLIFTVLEDALFSLSDFRQSDGRLVIFPEDPEDSESRTTIEVKRGDFRLYSKSDMNDLGQLWLKAAEEAKILASQHPSASNQKDAPTKQPNVEPHPWLIPPSGM